MAALLDEDDTFIDLPGMYSHITVLLHLGTLVAVFGPNQNSKEKTTFNK